MYENDQKEEPVSPYREKGATSGDPVCADAAANQPSWMKVTLVTAVVGGVVQILVNHFDAIVAALYTLLVHVPAIIHNWIGYLIPPGHNLRRGRRQAFSFIQ